MVNSACVTPQGEQGGITLSFRNIDQEVKEFYLYLCLIHRSLANPVRDGMFVETVASNLTSPSGAAEERGSTKSAAPLRLGAGAGRGTINRSPLTGLAPSSSGQRGGIGHGAGEGLTPTREG